MLEVDALIKIFSQLGVDWTIFVQFFIFLVLYFVLKNLFFNKLLEVLQFRENKTTKLEQEANKRMALADEMAKRYREQLDAIHHNAQGQLEKHQKEVIEGKKNVLQREEEKLGAQVEQMRDQCVKEFQQTKGQLSKYVDDLAQELVNKFAR